VLPQFASSEAPFAVTAPERGGQGPSQRPSSGTPRIIGTSAEHQSVSGAPELLAELRDPAAGGGAYETAWLTPLGRAVAHGEAAPAALHPRVAFAPTALLRNEYVTRGIPAVPDAVLTEIVDEVFLPLVHGRSPGND
jgi:hypothetical protein